ncbi:MAG: MATE family efflux transporter [Oscillospiraceae bacterium]|jgi:putative MATE family efflux protein|nr:MATE family efflux transporter [Oscillospiraceae bacterium]
MKTKLAAARHGIDLTEGGIPKLLMRYALPFLISGLISSLYGLVDMYVIGRYCSDTGIIAGVGTGTQVMNIVYTASIGIGTGGTVLIGRRIGEGDRVASAKATGTFISAGAIVSVLLPALIYIFCNPLLDLLRTPPEARESARLYVMYVTTGVPFVLMFNFLGAIARGLGNSRTPSIVGAAGCILNIALDFLFTGALGMREVGVAVATAVSQLFTFAAIGIWFLINKFPYEFSRRDFKIEKYSLFAVFRVGIPLWAQELLIHVSFMIITAIVNEMGVVASASVSIISKVFALGAIFPQAIGNAIAAITAQNIGANKRARAFSSMKWGILYSLIIEALFMTWWIIAPHSITSAFADAKSTPEVIDGAAWYLRSFAIDLGMLAFIFCINPYLSGCGKSYISMLHSLIATFAVRIPLSLLFSKLAVSDLNHHLFILGLAAPAASLLSIAICVFYVLRQQRQWKALPL